MTARAAVLPVVFDVNVLVEAVARGNAAFESFEGPPPKSDNASADCVGVANDAEEFALWLSPHILRNTHRVLIGPIGLDEDFAASYVTHVISIAHRSGGRIIEPEPTVTDCPDYADNRILELAIAANAAMIVSEDADLTVMPPWRGTPIIRAREFIDRVDAMRRGRDR